MKHSQPQLKSPIHEYDHSQSTKKPNEEMSDSHSHVSMEQIISNKILGGSNHISGISSSRGSSILLSSKPQIELASNSIISKSEVEQKQNSESFSKQIESSSGEIHFE